MLSQDVRRWYGVILCCLYVVFFFFKQKTAYEMRISDWSSDVCSSDLLSTVAAARSPGTFFKVRLRYPEYAAAHDLREDVEERLADRLRQLEIAEIGRASCRERVCQYV